MIWLNSSAEPVGVTTPENEWVHAGEVVPSTDPDLKQGTPVRAGEPFSLGARSLVVLRQT
jgi:glycogen operon protein